MKDQVKHLKVIYTGVTLFVFAVLVLRFGYLQIISWDRYFRVSERNRIREVVLEPERGLIYDRHGEILVDNRPSYSVSVVPYEFLKADSVVALVAEIIGMSPEQVRRKVRKSRVGNFTPVKVRRAIDFATLSRIEEHRLDLPGVFYNIESTRSYPAGIRAPHMFGYLGEITAEELEQRREQGYRMGDVIGKKGLELQYERFLRGEAGVKYLEVDALGREVRELTELAHRPARPGHAIYLSIDATLQRYLEQQMEGKRGAAVVLDPRNGEILALVSKPDYDPALFSKPISPEVWQSLLNDPGKPLFSRSFQSVYPPGSTFKLVLAAAGLETNRVDLTAKVNCVGTYRLGTRNFDCWKKGGHGPVDFYDAIEQSCNVYFYTLGLKVGLDDWAAFARRFGFGRRTGIDLPNETPGLVPDRTYFDAKYGKRGWTRGLLLNLSVGQGDLLVTPLQMAYLAMLVGNEGVGYQPHLVKEIVNRATGEVVEPEVQTYRVEGVSKQSYSRIKEGMARVVQGEHGTAKAARLPGVEVCGKTGTAQNPHGEDHAWFIGFAPRENPIIALAILVENGGSGGAVAAPLAGGVLRLRFKPSPIAQN